jgi:hypothetical protein
MTAAAGRRNRQITPGDIDRTTENDRNAARQHRAGRRCNMTAQTDKPARFTVAGIARRNQAAGGHYFDRDTLRFFDQRRSDFLSVTINGRIFVFGRGRRWTLGTGSVHAWSVAEFDPTDGDSRPYNKTTSRDLLPDSLTMNPTTTAADIRRALVDLTAGKVD